MNKLPAERRLALITPNLFLGEGRGTTLTYQPLQQQSFAPQELARDDDEATEGRRQHGVALGYGIYGERANVNGSSYYDNGLADYVYHHENGNHEGMVSVRGDNHRVYASHRDPHGVGSRQYQCNDLCYGHEHGLETWNDVVHHGHHHHDLCFAEAWKSPNLDKVSID